METGAAAIGRTRSGLFLFGGANRTPHALLSAVALEDVLVFFILTEDDSLATVDETFVAETALVRFLATRDDVATAVTTFSVTIWSRAL